jgi:hypothetical protein
MGILVAIVIAAGAAFGASKHDGVFKKDQNTTYKDTVEFEYQAARTVEDFQHAKAERLEARMNSWDNAPDSPSATPAPQTPEQKPGI